MYINYLILEVTRRCNMHCAHCLRGDAQDLDMPEEVIRKAMEPFERIGTLLFTGGEPALNIGAMRYALEFAKEKNIPVDSFSVVTNGKVVTDEFMLLMMYWDAYCESCNWEIDNPMIKQEKIPKLLRYAGMESPGGVALSQDPFHEPISVENIWKLQSLKCFKADEKNYFNGYTWYIAMGKATDSDFPQKTYNINEEDESEIYIEDDTMDKLYVNALGNFQGCCNLSYEVQDRYSKGSVLEDQWIERLFPKQEVA